MSPRARTLLGGTVSSLGVLAVVAWTTAPTVTFGDSGELLAAAITAGIPHPPGYPLWTLLAHASIRLLGFATPGAAVALFSSLCLGLAGLASFAAFRELTRCEVSATLGTLALCLAPLVWDSATVAEVYAMDLALLSCGMWLATRACGRLAEGETLRPAFCCALGLALGSGLAHRSSHAAFHLGYVAWLVWSSRGGRMGTRAWLALGLGYGLGLLPWLWLPIRGGAWQWLPEELRTAPYAFQDVRTLGDFVALVTAKRYSYFLWGAGPRLWGLQLGFDGRVLGAQWLPPLWLGAAMGLACLRRVGARAVPALVVLTAGWLLFWNWAVMDPEPFLQPFLLGSAALLSLALSSVPERLPRHSAVRLGLWVVAAGSIAWAVPGTWRAVDRSSDLSAQDYACDVLEEVAGQPVQIVAGCDYTVGWDHRSYPLIHAYRAYGRGGRLWVWPIVQEDDVSWREFLDFLALEPEERERLAVVGTDRRSHEMALLAEETGLIRSAGSSWPSDGGAWTEALGWTSALRTSEPRDPPDTERPARLVAKGRRMLAQRPTDRYVRAMASAPFLELAQELCARHRAGEAVEALELGLSVMPDSLPLHEALGDALLSAGEIDRGLAELDSARGYAECFADWHEATRRLGWRLHQQGRWAEAIPALRDAIARRPESGEWGTERQMLDDCLERVGAATR